MSLKKKVKVVTFHDYFCGVRYFANTLGWAKSGMLHTLRKFQETGFHARMQYPRRKSCIIKPQDRLDTVVSSRTTYKNLQRKDHKINEIKNTVGTGIDIWRWALWTVLLEWTWWWYAMGKKVIGSLHWSR